MNQTHNTTLNIDIINYYAIKDDITNTYLFS